MVFSKKLVPICKLHIVLLPDLLYANFNFEVEVENWSKMSHTRKYIYKKACDHNHDVIYRSYLSRGILKISFQLVISCQEICK